MRPLVDGIRLSIILNSVLLPAPLWPIRPNSWPRRMDSRPRPRRSDGRKSQRPSPGAGIASAGKCASTPGLQFGFGASCAGLGVPRWARAAPGTAGRPGAGLDGGCPSAAPSPGAPGQAVDQVVGLVGHVAEAVAVAVPAAVVAPVVAAFAPRSRPRPRRARRRSAPARGWRRSRCPDHVARRAGGTGAPDRVVDHQVAAQRRTRHRR